MRNIKYIVTPLVILSGLLFLFGPEVIPENFQLQEILNKVKNKDVIIVFNSGGWGDTPLDKAQDFASVIAGIQQTLNAWGYKSVVIPYARTKDNFWGRVTGAKEFFNSFRNSSKDLAKEVEFLGKKFPDKKIIMAGLSSGGTFVTETYEKISGEVKDSVYAVAVGTPFWVNTPESDNVLQLNNSRKDTLSVGNVKSLLLSLVEAPFKWIFSKIIGQNLKFSQAFQVPGHNYPWSSSEVSSQIVIFLEKKF